ncbi:MAG: hypothetical protein H7173_13975, partial [Rhodoferax sp.]|nr:hypothetical protein [Pseudorhodobacter sp.]
MRTSRTGTGSGQSPQGLLDGEAVAVMRRVAIIRQSVPIVSLQRVAFDAQAIVMPAGMALTLNGVVQGFIADKVAVLLAAEGLTD